jgi:signal transduction histidine kinase
VGSAGAAGRPESCRSRGMHVDSLGDPTLSLLHRTRPNGTERRRQTLLIVDDEVDVLESLRHQFHRNYRVLTSNSGPAAIDLLEHNDVEVLLSDQRMPGMPGDVLLRKAREVKPDTIRMLFTGYADIQAVINAVNEGHIYRYILKPWDSVELEGIIRQGIEQYELLADRRRLVAELQEANARLVEANGDLARAGQLKTAFIEVASHEFNTPITLVLGLTDLLRLFNPNRTDQEQEILRQITASGRQLARLVTSMLTLLRAEDFRKTLERQPVDVSDLIRGVVDQIRPFVKARGLQLHVQVADGLGTFELDADKIGAVLINLLTNAIKFTPDGGQVWLKAGLTAAGEVEIVVEDRGIGLEPRALEHLFQPFFTQFDPSRHSSGDFGFCKRGLGLGLCIAKQFVDMHGGRIFAESLDAGGTRVTTILPRTPRTVEDGPDSGTGGAETLSPADGAPP